MTNATTSQGLSGLASGAVMGASVGGPWGAVIGGVVGGVAGLFSGSATDSSAKNQSAWADYNSRQQYQISMSNIQSQNLLATFNAAMTMSSGNIQAQNISDTALFNAGVIQATTEYNDSLLEEEEALMWEAAELDIHQIENQRARERGDIIARQGASGTVIGEGSNADVVIDQMTQESLDTFIVRHGADIQASKINNQRAESLWQGEMAIKETMWNGEVGAYMATTNASMQAMGGLMTTAMSGSAGTTSAGFALQSGQAGIAQSQSAYSQQNTNNMVNGLFSSASQATASYYGSKVPTSSYDSASYGAGVNSGYTSGSQITTPSSTKTFSLLE